MMCFEKVLSSNMKKSTNFRCKHLSCECYSLIQIKIIIKYYFGQREYEFECRE